MNGFIDEKRPTFSTIISHQRNSRVALISFGGAIYQHSTRPIAAYLRGKGYKVSIIQCVSSNDNDERYFALLTKEQLEELGGHCKGMLAVGISVLTTHYVNRAIQVNDYLKKSIKAPIVWGGVPVICDPEYYLNFADYVCVGEGEYFMEEFLRNIQNHEPLNRTRGMAYLSLNNKMIQTHSIPLVDINNIPLPLYDLEHHYFLKDNLVSLKDDPRPLIGQIAQRGYSIFSIRGCPLKCSFCCNNKLSTVFEGQKILRKQRPDLIIKELLSAIELVPEINEVWFEDDDFFCRTDGELEELMGLYKKEINLPISIFATIKLTNERKLNILKHNKIKIESIKIGLQSASSRVNREIYRRPFNREEYLEKLPMLAQREIPTIVDVISDNPFENINDKIESLDFFIQLSNNLKEIKDANNYLTYLDHKLMFYPGTELYNRSLNEGIISKDYISDTLLKRTTARKEKEIDIDKIILALFRISLKHKKIVFIMKLMKKKVVMDLVNIEVIRKVLFLALRLRNIWQKMVSIS